jgi:hypothetical protein
MVEGSNVSACHISNWLIALLGMKLHPTSQGWRAYHSLAFSGDQREGMLILPPVMVLASVSNIELSYVL